MQIKCLWIQKLDFDILLRHQQMQKMPLQIYRTFESWKQANKHNYDDKLNTENEREKYKKR